MAGTWIEVGARRLRVVMDGEVVHVDGVRYDLDMQELQPGVLSLLWTEEDGRVRSFRCVADGDAVIVDGERVEYGVYDPRSLRGANAAAGASGPKALKAPMPGRVVRVLVTEGDAVEAGQGCVVIEAMKMQNELKAPKAGVVRKLMVAAGETVGAGAALLVVE